MLAARDRDFDDAPEVVDPIITPVHFRPPGERPWKPNLRLPLRRTILSVLCIVCGVGGWFLVTARAVRIHTDPTDASVSVRGGLKVHIGHHLLMRRGRYRIHITALGYYGIDEPLVIGPSRSQEIAYTLSKLPGQLRVDTAQLQGAHVFIDGELRGDTPALIRELAAGEHRMQVVAARYLPFDATVVIEGRGVEQTLPIALTPAWAAVSVTSQPAGAEVYVDDELVGQAPLTTEVMQGKHDLRVQLSHFKPWHAGVVVVANQPLTLPPIELQPADAVVLLETNPPGCGVTVDGEYRGRTPIEVAVTPRTPATLRLFKEGYKQASRTVTLASGETQPMHVNLEAELAAVSITVTPPDAEITVDGQRVGNGQVLKLTTAPHRVTARKPGYAVAETMLTPRAGIAQLLHIGLKTQEEARVASVKPTAQTAAGQELKLFHPNEVFTMGASRREPGRQANEALHQVRLTRPFYLSEHPVTNSEFKQFDATHSSGLVEHHTLDTPKQPVVRVSWQQAALYCNWLSARDGLPPFYQVANGKVVGFTPGSTGYRLPSEAEWEWAARAQPGGHMRKFPWGDQLPPTPKSGNYADRSATTLIGRVLEDYDDGYAVAAPVGSFAANEKGLFDLGSNVSEWIHDFYDIPVESAGITTDPLGAPNGQHHVIRGASWAQSGLTELRLSHRDYGADGREDLGFRIARYSE